MAMMFLSVVGIVPAFIYAVCDVAASNQPLTLNVLSLMPPMRWVDESSRAVISRSSWVVDQPLRALVSPDKSTPESNNRTLKPDILAILQISILIHLCNQSILQKLFDCFG